MVIKASDIMTPAEIAAIPPGTIKTSCNHAPVQIPVIPRKAEVKIPVRDMSWIKTMAEEYADYLIKTYGK